VNKAIFVIQSKIMCARECDKRTYADFHF